MLRAAFDGGHREAAGIGEEVEYPLAAGILADPVAAVAHVEEQTVVLLLAQVQLEAQSALADDTFIHRLAPEQLDRAFQQIAVLQQQRSCLALTPGRRFDKAQQHRLQRGVLVFERLTEQRYQHHTLQPVDRHLLKPRPASTAAMEEAAHFARRGLQGESQVLFQGGGGVEIHGGRFEGKRGGILTRAIRPAIRQDIIQPELQAHRFSRGICHPPNAMIASIRTVPTIAIAPPPTQGLPPE
ncbi:hypothetical protein FQZ97_829250 [compost metagenome]